MTHRPCTIAILATALLVACATTDSASATGTSAQPPRATPPAARASGSADLHCASSEIEVPSRIDVQSAMRDSAERIRACFADHEGRRSVLYGVMSFDCSGAATTVALQPESSAEPWWTEAEGACVLQALQGSRMPAFRRPEFRVSYPFVP